MATRIPHLKMQHSQMPWARKRALENRGNEHAFLMALFSFYRSHYPREGEWLLSLYMKRVVEDKMTFENEEGDLSTKLSSTNETIKTAGSVASRSVNGVFVPSFKGMSECAADSTHNEECTGKKLHMLGLYFHNSSWQGFKDFFKKIQKKIVRRWMVAWWNPHVLLAKAVYQIYTDLL